MIATDKPLIGITTDLKDKENSIESAYSRAIDYYGGIPILIPTLKEHAGYIKNIVNRIDGLLIPGSRDMDPKFYNQLPHSKINPMNIERTLVEFKIMEESLNRGMPILGICGGMQFINVFYGGSLYQDIKEYLPDALNHEKGAIHKVILKEDTALGDLSDSIEFEVNSYHHQAVKEVGGDLKINAQAADSIVEGIENSLDKVMAVQWHPELEFNEISELIFKDFLSKASEK
ncbi:MAG: hypothetical protein GTO02_03330 [Candidatus Dadabacteria bacterium]|nr:hypothetical protein [Candidatus Dadabacteria bacterium]NIQ13461.1 hypothetical protein [Candidatus Dadabacteria bacterium]